MNSAKATEPHRTRLRHWLVMVSLCLSGGVIYLLPYLREMYREPLRAALELDNAEFELLAAVAILFIGSRVDR